MIGIPAMANVAHSFFPNGLAFPAMVFLLLLLSVEGLARGNGKTTYASIGFARSLACGFVPVIRVNDFSARRENGKPPNEDGGECETMGGISKHESRLTG